MVPEEVLLGIIFLEVQVVMVVLVEVLQGTIHKMELEQVQELMDKVFLVEMEAEVTTQVVVVELEEQE